MSNYYWPTYRNLEKEVLELSKYIHFSDDQLDTYSLHIADLIVRCAIEIEGLSKELYSINGGNMSPVDNARNPRDLYFDTDCIELLCQKFQINKKRINVVASTFYFDKDENKNIAPLHKANKRGTSGSQWKQAYQGVKHDRKNWLKRANIKNLIYALGALYILNVYYKFTEPIVLGRVTKLKDDNPADSDIFSSVVYSATGITRQVHMSDDCIIGFDRNEYEKAVFVKKVSDSSFRELHQNINLDNKDALNNFANSKTIQDYMRLHPDCRGKSIIEICNAAGGRALVNQIITTKRSTKFINEFIELKLNTNDAIYPDLPPL